MRSLPQVSNLQGSTGNHTTSPTLTARVAAIVLTWNGREYTVACLRSLAGMSAPVTYTIVVDNGSVDGTVATVQQQFPETIVLQNQENVGFARGNNRGLRFGLREGVDYFFLLNNDVVVDTHCLSNLLATIEVDPLIGVVGPKVYYHKSPENIQSAGGLVIWRPRPTRLIGEGELDRGQYDRVRDVDFVSGCALLVKQAAVQAAGLLDPRFFAYYEDVDWSIRIRRAGFRVVYVPQARVWHVGCASPPNRSAFRAYYNYRNELLFVRRHASVAIRWFYYFRSLRIVGKQCLRALTSSRRHEALAALRGIRDFYLYRYGRGTYDPPSQIFSSTR